MGRASLADCLRRWRRWLRGIFGRCTVQSTCACLFASGYWISDDGPELKPIQTTHAGTDAYHERWRRLLYLAACVVALPAVSQFTWVHGQNNGPGLPGH